MAAGYSAEVFIDVIWRGMCDTLLFTDCIFYKTHIVQCTIDYYAPCVVEASIMFRLHFWYVTLV